MEGPTALTMTRKMGGIKELGLSNLDKKGLKKFLLEGK